MGLLRINGMIEESIVDGPGLRFVIFTQGCPHHCPGCHNPQTHDPRGGFFIDTHVLLSKICENPLLKGVTFSGGEPFAQPENLAELAASLHKKGLDIMTYTGYTLEALRAKNTPAINALLRQTDTLIDGPYDATKRDPSLAFRGSSNQRMIHSIPTVLNFL
ncbi:MAG: anaerobic ribonucleoside-triphosphate reductase activating protein [Eubacterium sp.]